MCCGTCPAQAGNRVRRDPLEGSEAPHEQNHARETLENTLRFANTSTKLAWIAEQARRHPERCYTSLHHLIDEDWMREAYRCTRKDGAPGVDGVMAADYERKLEANLGDLLDRIKSGRYYAPPVRRHYIPKADGKQRPLGIPTFEDKVAQRAIVMLLEPIYEADFLPFSYGFRPQRSAHDALEAVNSGIMRQWHRWVIDADVAGYFDNISHAHLRTVLDLRMKDGVVRRMIDRWLKAGVLEDGTLQRARKGTPQGGVISPLLANIFLHHVLDKWFAETVQPRLRGSSQLVRYADDFVLTFAYATDGQRVLHVLGKRLERFGLKLHATKTRYVDFRPPQGGSGRESRPSFDLLGFTHVWGRTRRGKWALRRYTAKKRFARAVKAVNDWCKKHRHLSLPAQQAHLSSVIRGHCQYYGLTGNGRRLAQFRHQMIRIWRKWLSRRSRKSHINWKRMQEVLRSHPLPTARVVHSIYVTQAKLPWEEPSASTRTLGSGAPG